MDLLGAGWLDSDITEGNGLWRHCIWPGLCLDPQPASDAIVFMLWLANHTENNPLESRLRQEAAMALARRQQDDAAYMSGVSTVYWQIISALLFGNVTDHVLSRQTDALNQARQFDANGTRHYPQGDDDPSFASTHFADHTSGYSAAVLERVLEAASLSGDVTLMERSLDR